MRTKLWLISLGVMSGTLFAAPIESMPTESQLLQTEQRQIDQDETLDSQHVAILSKDFDVSPETIEARRRDNQKWSEITTALVAAQLLNKQDTGRYPTLEAGLSRVEALRAAGQDWGNVIDGLGLKIEPVVAATRRVHDEFHADIAEHREIAKAEQGRRNAGEDTPSRHDAAPAGPREESPDIERAQHGDQPERIELADRPDRPERIEIPERPERIEVPERPERVETPERPERIELPERPERPERVEAPERPERVEHVERVEHADRPEHHDNHGH
jgi:hypothetical protein